MACIGELDAVVSFKTWLKLTRLLAKNGRDESPTPFLGRILGTSCKVIILALEISAPMLIWGLELSKRW